MDAGFEEVYRLHGPAVHAYLVRLTGDRSTADEVCQEAFVRYLERRSELRNANGSLRPWLFRVASNLVADAARRARPLPLEAEPPAREPADGAEVRDLADRLRREVQALPEPLRAAFLLRAHHELTHAQVAEALGIAERTAKERFRLAREILAHRLGPLFFENRP